VTPMHRKSGTKVPYVALCLTLSQSSLKPGYVMHALFELSIYNHSNGSYCGCKGIFLNLFFKSRAFLLQLLVHACMLK
jgi:hypothetical protein